ncbi:MAG: replication-associated recombination protein A, partial [Candidatus Omnitrophica bacterium]|nr:replication-associated recombination protein A [Candidatus Omnitrophota bacterium]
MSGLFQSRSQSQTLAVRMRPRDISEFLGQRHLLGEGKILNRALKAGRISSLIFYGPPGTGKTCLALVIREELNAYFVRLNAVASNVQEIRDVLRSAKYKLEQEGKKTILFIDEIHRFNKAQQDVLLPDVEMGNPILIGATTHNPFFALTPPLISRSLICEFKPLSKEDILLILKRALTDKERGLGNYKIKIENKVLQFFAQVSDGDARRALNALEIAVLTTPEDKNGIRKIDLKIAEDSIQKKAVLYDRDEDAHYDTISAFIKAMRGSDPDATLYWLAKMIYAGEDPRFIARRILIAAAEDVGNADPQALIIAQAACYAVEYLGMPEAKIPLAQAAIYVACAPKSNSCYVGIEKALEDVEKGKLLEVPQHLKDSHYKGAKKLGRGQDYKYP